MCWWWCRRLELEEKREKGAFQEQGALGYILELEKRDPKVGGDRGGNRLFVGNEDATDGMLKLNVDFS
ncbi:hypothetical protein Lal_00032192 [Lupinus albus]|nr:hypothetical protein Lal_00032192 [Lupinus albus]